MLYDVTNTIELMEVFLETCNFDVPVNEIAVQSELYMQQKVTPFSTNHHELKTFIGMNYIMDYYRLLSIRDYRSTQQCC